jgi:hypothetical protein
MKYVLDRLREPGTMRSLIWVLLSVAGYATTEAEVAQYALMATALLGMVSALLPEKSTKAAEKVEQAATTAQVAATTAASAVNEVASVTRQASQVLDSARNLAEASNVAAIIRPTGGKL